MHSSSLPARRVSSLRFTQQRHFLLGCGAVRVVAVAANDAFAVQRLVVDDAARTRRGLSDDVVVGPGGRGGREHRRGGKQERHETFCHGGRPMRSPVRTTCESEPLFRRAQRVKSRQLMGTAVACAIHCRRGLASMFRNRASPSNVTPWTAKESKYGPRTRQRNREKGSGAIKDTACKMTGDKDLETEGKLDKAEGSARKVVGDVKDAVKH